MNLPSIESISAAVTESNLLGRGGNAKVYDLKGHPDFVVRVESRVKDMAVIAAPVEIDNSSFQGRNYGQAVAQYAEGVTVLHRQHGIPAGVPPHLSREEKNQASSDNMYEQGTALAARMPQEAYVELLRDMQFV